MTEAKGITVILCLKNRLLCADFLMSLKVQEEDLYS